MEKQWHYCVVAKYLIKPSLEIKPSPEVIGKKENVANEFVELREGFQGYLHLKRCYEKD